MPQSLTIASPRTPYAGPYDAPAANVPPASGTASTSGLDAVHGMVACDRECPYCWGPETD